MTDQDYLESLAGFADLFIAALSALQIEDRASEERRVAEFVELKSDFNHFCGPHLVRDLIERVRTANDLRDALADIQEAKNLGDAKFIAAEALRQRRTQRELSDVYHNWGTVHRAAMHMRALIEKPGGERDSLDYESPDAFVGKLKAAFVNGPDGAAARLRTIYAKDEHHEIVRSRAVRSALRHRRESQAKQASEDAKTAKAVVANTTDAAQGQAA